MQNKTTLFVSFISFRSIAAASETPGIPYTPGVYALRPAPSLSISLSLSLFFLFLLLFSASKSAPARRTSLHTFVRSFVLYPGLYSAFPLPPSRSPLAPSLSCTLFLFFLYRSRSMGRGPIRTHVALVGKIEATARHAPRPRAFRASRRLDGSPSPLHPRDVPSGRPNERLAPRRTFQLTDDSPSRLTFLHARPGVSFRLGSPSTRLV